MSGVGWDTTGDGGEDGVRYGSYVIEKDWKYFTSETVYPGRDTKGVTRSTIGWWCNTEVRHRHDLRTHPR